MPGKSSKATRIGVAAKKPAPNRISARSKAKMLAAKAERRALRYAAELKRVSEQKAAGLDPLVGIDFATRYVKKCRATIYKKLGNGFPEPIKHGRSNAWTLSKLDLYRETNHD